MEKPYYPPPSSDEINLLPILRYIKRKIDGFFYFIGYLVSLLFRQYKYIACFSLAGLAIGMLYYFFKPPVYKSTAIYTSNLMNNQFNEAFVNELRWLTREKNHDELSTLLSMSHDQVRSLKKIEFEPFEVSTMDTMMRSSFKIHVYVDDIVVFDTLQYKLLGYLENNIYGHKRKSAKVSSLELFADKMHDEMVELDSIKKIVSLKTGELSNLVETYRQVIDLYMERYKLMEQMALSNNYELIQRFSSFRKPYSPRLRELAVFVVLSCLIGIYFAHKKEKRGNKEKPIFKSVDGIDKDGLATEKLSMSNK